MKKVKAQKRKREYQLILIFIVMLGLFGLADKSKAATIYVDQTLISDCTSGNYSTEHRNCTGTEGNAYSTLQDVLWGTDGTNGAANVGDKIYLREGTYSEDWTSSTTSGAAMQIPTRLNGTAWTEGNYTTISSYPGEWAIINADNVSGNAYLFGYGDAAQNTGIGGYKYWVIERLEFTGGASAGLAIKYGPVKVRYCYIHGNGYGSIGDRIKSGLHMRNGHECTIEYNYFVDNAGNTDDNKNHIDNFSDYMFDDVLSEGSPRYSWNYCNRDNEIRYNYFGPGPSNSYKDKGSQYLTNFNTFGSSASNADMTQKEHGNKIHHNISLGPQIAFYYVQDFEQIYNNITNGDIGVAEETRPHFGTSIYNNTVFNSYIIKDIDDDFDGIAGPELWTSMDLNTYIANNISSGGISNAPDIGIAISWNETLGVCTYSNNYTWDNTVIDRNLIYQPVDNFHFGLPNSYWSTATTPEGLACRAASWLTAASFNVLKGANNYTSSVSGLFGSFGADQYKTDGGFDLDGTSGTRTIADGGYDAPHPYLTDVRIPKYVGATNPIDNNWVQGVLNLNSAYFTTVSSGSTPAWVEDNGIPGDTTAPANPVGLSVS